MKTLDFLKANLFMQRKFFFACFLFLFSALLLAACSDSDDKSDEEEIPVADFVLDESYSWTLSKQKDEFYIVNSYEEMQKYIEAAEEAPAIANIPDFENRTLLLLSGITLYGVDTIEKKLIRCGGAHYTFEVDVTTNAACVVEGFIVAVTVPKLNDGAEVTKNVTVH